MTTAQQFNPVAYKETTRQQWDSAAEAWDDWGAVARGLARASDRPRCSTWPASATAQVLDVAAGAGGQTHRAARLVGPGGRVLATDISPAILGSRAAQVRPSPG